MGPLSIQYLYKYVSHAMLFYLDGCLCHCDVNVYGMTQRQQSIVENCS